MVVITSSMPELHEHRIARNNSVLAVHLFGHFDYEDIYMIYVSILGSALLPNALATASATVE
jgi:hypothetical protein